LAWEVGVWLLILEGVPAILAGALTYFYLPARPAEAKFLTNQEKNWISAELASEELQKGTANKMTAIQALTHKRVWHLTAIYFPGTIGWYTAAFWMPQLIKAISTNYSNTTVGVLVTIPYAVAFAAMVLVGRSSDRNLERRYHAAIPLIIGAISFIALSVTSTRSVFITVALRCLVVAGIQCAWSPIWSLPNEFLAGVSAAAGLAFINSGGEPGRVYRPIRYGRNQPGNWKLPWGPCLCWHFLVHLGNAADRLAKER